MESTTTPPTPGTALEEWVQRHCKRIACLCGALAALSGAFALGRATTPHPAPVAPVVAPQDVLTGGWLMTGGDSVDWLNILMQSTTAGTITYQINGLTVCQDSATDTTAMLHAVPATPDTGTFTFACGGGMMQGSYTPTTLTVDTLPAVGVNDTYTRASFAQYQAALASVP